MAAPVPVIILAGGQGTRIGGGKAERLLAGRTLLEHAIARARLYSPMAAVAAGKNALPVDIPMIEDKGDVQGPIAGLAGAFDFARAAGATHVLIMPCDTPFLPDDLLQRLRAAIGEARAALARCAGQVHPACSLWRVDSASLLPAYLAQGRRSLSRFAESTGFVPVDWPSACADRFFNVNSAADLLQAAAIYSALP